MICQSILLKRPHWTVPRIKKFLKEPDFLIINPHGWENRPMKLFSMDRVEWVESTPEFQKSIRKPKNC